ncbi:MAG TPA: hypothetical protein VH278_04380 [Burkholderiaceae bacterium]|jgi:hypothetical protein|nr:hypothetical protein [Burkholderiaceae bacterium]
MDLEVVDALKAAGVPDDKARAVVVSLHREIDQRYALHAAQLSTRTDLVEAVGAVKLEIAETVGAVKLEMARLHAESMGAIARLETKMTERMAETKVELIRWFLGSFIAFGGVLTAIVRMTGH